MKTTRELAAVVVILLGITNAVIAQAEFAVAELEIHNPPVDGEDGLVVTFMGTTTLIISDGETRLITDGYFTRANFGLGSTMGGLIAPDRNLIEHYLGNLNIDEAAAVMVVHSHFDHSLDAPIVAELTGADLLGSESTANIGRGLDLAEEQIRAVEPGEPMAYGDFTVTFFVSKHWPIPEPYASVMLNTTIDEPLVPPARFDDYKEGKTYSILLEHPQGNILIQASAGYLPGALDGVQADIIMFGTGGLGDLVPEEQENYFREIVTTTGAHTVYPIHWDTSVTPLSEPLVPDQDFQRAMQFLEKKNREAGVDYALLPFAEPVRLIPRQTDP